jgi:hypothetical protein
MKEVTIGGNTYSVERPSAEVSWELHRRVSGMAMAAFQAIAMMGSGSKDSFVPALQVFAPAFASLPRDDAEYIMRTCLSHATRKNPDGSWPQGKVYRNGVIAYSDISPFAIDVLIFEALRLALGNFMDEFLTYQRPGNQGPDTAT